MNPALNNQPRQGRWPNQVDTALDRARKVAAMYRHHLNVAVPNVCATLDATIREFGEDEWLLERPEVVDPDQELTAAEAAELVRAEPNTIHHWARLNRKDGSGQKVLPRFGWRGRERTFIAGKVLEAAVLMRNGQHAGR